MRNPVTILSGLAAGVLAVGLVVCTQAAPLPEIMLSGLTQGKNSITGVVFDPSRRPVPNLRIELLDEVEARLSTTQTDSTGRYSFTSLSDGNFLIRPVTAGTNFVNQTYRVQLILAGGRGAHHEQLDLYLKLRRPAADAAEAGNPGLIFAQAVPEAARKAYERGVDLIDNRNDAEAGISSLKEAITLFPDYYLALERLGMEQVRRQQFEPARMNLYKATTVNPKGDSSYYLLGVAQYSLKEYPASIEALRKMLSLAPASPNAPYGHYYMGLALLRNGSPAEAELELKKAYEDGAKRVPTDCHMALAQIYSNSKRYKEAADELEIYLKETPDAKDAERIKGIIGLLRSKAK